MDFDFQWLLIGLPVAFALGWLASRFDLRQVRRDNRDAPRAYFKGLNLLLNEQQDKAIDAFIEAVQHDPDTTELHFALGNLFRRRGEFERAVRVHEHLLSRADLKTGERDRAQHELAQDYMRAGLFDRAEQAYRALEGTAFETEAWLALLALQERSRSWRAAIDIATRLDKGGTGSYAPRIAHYWCELAEEADAAGNTADADTALRRALEAAPHAARPRVIAGRRARAAGRHGEAVELWDELGGVQPGAFALVAADYAASGEACGRLEHVRDQLAKALERSPSLDVLQALGRLDPASQPRRLADSLRQQPSLTAAHALLATPPQPAAGDPAALELVEQALARAARPLHRYRCAACGFEAHQYFWQCPGCLSWDSYPPRRVDES
ncbi:lipopolysaccharide assembly protein LapB [Rubrivivax benzoatilyticus]|uniref:Lipopolysaccharide assembly protein B n=1 Tax=Rubrivivax benzoatilyticus TaxID=316997 RepID=A0ABX0HQW4_9BURK|nr:lipopolysaccharide assembly protein LapB [Rubrivivax benzoatilyticus]NHK97460.1 lipopolysaccharide assembly protein LapB [Rubrivivax benzoatilyticus]NHL22845.1 lipopolysaccharide assembly protein LapB [Rubrivivax benzoatilyticus]